LNADALPVAANEGAVDRVAAETLSGSDRAEGDERDGRRRGRGRQRRGRDEVAGNGGDSAEVQAQVHAVEPLSVGEVQAARSEPEAEISSRAVPTEVEALPNGLAATRPSAPSEAPADTAVAAQPEEPAHLTGQALPAATPAAVVTPAADVAPLVDAAPFVLQTDALQAVAESAGLQWVGSDHDKIKAAQEAMANEPKPVRVPRLPKPVVAVDDGPLVLVETQRDLSQVVLPFETSPTPPAANAG
jgi:ribonuclease E